MGTCKGSIEEVDEKAGGEVMWELDNGLKLIRALQEETRAYGYHLCLGGSVLNFGESGKDIDLYFLPMNNSEYDESPEKLILWLEKLWGKYKKIGDYGKEMKFKGVNFNWDEIIPTPGQLNAPPTNAPFPEDNPFIPPKKKTKWSGPTVYKFKLKFVRPDGNRIDVFIL
jgi:hypothetical protein